jgi:hypothetical protein
MKFLDYFHSRKVEVNADKQSIYTESNNTDFKDLLSLIGVLSENMIDLLYDLVESIKDIDLDKQQSDQFYKSTKILEFTLSNLESIISFIFSNELNKNHNCNIGRTLQKVYSGLNFQDLSKLQSKTDITVIQDNFDYNFTGNSNTISMILVLLVNYLSINGYKSKLKLKANPCDDGIHFEITCQEPIDINETTKSIIDLVDNPKELSNYDRNKYIFGAILRQVKSIGYKINVIIFENRIQGYKLIIP